MFIDTHAHYDDERYEEDREQVLADVIGSGVGVVVNAAQDVRTTRLGIEMAQKFPYIYCTAGIHPHEAQRATQLWTRKESCSPICTLITYIPSPRD